MTTKEQLSKWDQILVGMEKCGFKVSDTREVGPPYYSHLESDVTYQNVEFPLKSSWIIDYPFLDSVALTRRLVDGQDYTFLPSTTFLPSSQKPLDITLSYRGSVDDIDRIREQLIILGQRRVSTNELDPYKSRIEYPTAVTKGVLKFSQVFQKLLPRGNCSMELDITPESTQAFEQGLLPNHTRQENHYCITTPTQPLFPIPIEGITDFTASFNRLVNLTPARFNQLFKGMPLPRSFTICYGYRPFVYVMVGFGGEILELEVGVRDIEAIRVAKELASRMDIFDQYYTNFQAYQREYPVVV